MRRFFGLVFTGLALAVPVFAQDNVPPTVQLISWEVTAPMGGATTTVFSPTVGNRGDIDNYIHREGDIVTVGLLIQDLNWDPNTMMDGNNPAATPEDQDTIRVRVYSQPLGLDRSPVAPPISSAFLFPALGMIPLGEFVPGGEDGLPPTSSSDGFPPPDQLFVELVFEVPEFAGVSQRRLRGLQMFDVEWVLVIEVVNEIPSEGGRVPTNATQFFGAIQAPSDAINPPPFADAGPDQRVPVGTTVTLDAARTFDGSNIGFNPDSPDVLNADRLIYSWEWVTGPVRVDPEQVDPADATAKATLNTIGTYVFRVSADDQVNSLPSTAEVTIEAVAELPPNRKPTAVITAPVTQILEGGILTLSGAESFDPDEDADLKYRWRQVDELGANLKGEDVENLFQPISGLEEQTAMWQALKPGTFYFRLIVNDGEFVSTATTSIEVLADTNSARTARQVNGTGNVADAADSGATPVINTPACGLGVGLLGLAPLALLPMRRRFRR
ncbi:MAG: hypothetical protein KDA32_02285 [Phycisphaerales bacterium]|nr:hypothetical protein [Phycisphaerales bacterium]